MPLGDILPFRRIENPYTSWPPPPLIKPLRSRAENLTPAANTLIEDSEEIPYPPTLVIALGKTGEQVLRLIAQKISQNTTSGSAAIRALLISDGLVSDFPSSGRQIRVLELQQPDTLYIPKNTPTCERAKPVVLFQQVYNYKRYQDWLQENLLDLGTGIQVFFTGSLADPTTGIIGDALQILRHFPQNLGRANLFNRVCVFLTTDSTNTVTLPEEERFAAAREIGRFTFSGPHRMNTTFGYSNVVESALLDYFFLVDNTLPSGFSRQGKIDPAQLLAEALFSMIHPSAASLWENLLNDLRFSASIREESHQAVVHSVGVATLYIPLQQIRRYLAARLGYAALFGERKSKDEGLLSLKDSIEQPERIARQWLLQGGSHHPVFEWLLGLSSSADFNQIPDLDQEYDMAFASQMAHGLHTWLNRDGTSLPLTLQGLKWLNAHLARCQEWLEKGKTSHTDAAKKLQTRLKNWQQTVQAFSAELEKWKDALLASSPKDIPATTEVGSSDWRNWRTSSTHKLTDTSSSTSTNWRNWRSSENAVSSQETPTVPTTASSVLMMLHQRRAEAEADLRAASNDRIYRSALIEKEEDLAELEKYYSDTVRPELSSADREPSPVFTRVRQRLEWWIRLPDPHSPQILLVCWPASAYGQAFPPENYCFRPEQKQALVDAILQLSLSQTNSLEADLTTKWFGSRVRSQIDFLRRAEDAYLRYDHNIASKYKDAATRRSYLISHDKTLSLALLHDVFPETPRFALNVLENGSRSRFTALTFRMNIPFDAVLKLQEYKQTYKQSAPETLHLYPQERAAAGYEKRWWKLRREELFIPPEITVLLAEPNLVSLFWQSLFSGLIQSIRNELTGEAWWQVSALPVELPPNASPEFPPLPLAPVQPNGLLLALRRFALELPNAADVTHNPQNHFHPQRRDRYISLLTEETRSRLFTSQAMQARESLKPKIESWKQQALRDPLANAFSAILECEWEEPVWLKW